MERLSSKVMRTAPKRIWLQCGDDPEASRCNFSELAEVTWSSDKATTVCIEYVRADLVREAPGMLAALRQSVMALAWASEQKPEFAEAYAAVDAAIAKAVGMPANA